jgi:fatty-acyl-CoA synthase
MPLHFSQRASGVPEKIRFIDSIDKTSVGKVNKRVLREKYR